MSHPARDAGHACAFRRQSGVIMIVTLIALVVLLLGAAALLRSTDTAQFAASNLAFKRDLVNQGERGFAKAVTLLSSGALAAEATRAASQPANNYSATRLASDSHGIPLVLTMSDTDFAKNGMTLANDLQDSTTRVSVRYVIDRQCVAGGASTPSGCTLGASVPRVSGGSENTLNFDEPGPPIYRITVRAQGPRQSETYLQMSVAL